MERLEEHSLCHSLDAVHTIFKQEDIEKRRSLKNKTSRIVDGNEGVKSEFYMRDE